MPTYPVIQYGARARGGDAIGSGFVYNGKAIPALRGKYLFTDISTGRIWYADYKDMLAADDGNPKHDGRDSRGEGPLEQQRVRHDVPITEAAYHVRGGKDPDLPGRGTVSGSGRAESA